MRGKAQQRLIDEAIAATTVALKTGGAGLSFDERGALFFAILCRIEEREGIIDPAHTALSSLKNCGETVGRTRRNVAKSTA